MKRVEIFKTDVRKEEDAANLLSCLSGLYPVYQINFDLEDEENILRIETSQFEIETNNIINHMVELGHNCQRID